MSKKEVAIDHSLLDNPQTIDKVYRDHGIDTRAEDVVSIEDDGDGEYSKGKRIVKLRNRKFYGPWSHRG